MTDSNFTSNTTSECQQPMPTQPMPKTHDADCTCDTCCKISNSNCQDNRDECEKTQSSSERIQKTMKTRIMQIAVLLASITFTGVFDTAKATDRLLNIYVDVTYSLAVPDLKGVTKLNRRDLELSAADVKNARQSNNAYLTGTSINLSDDEIDVEVPISSEIVEQKQVIDDSDYPELQDEVSEASLEAPEFDHHLLTLKADAFDLERSIGELGQVDLQGGPADTSIDPVNQEFDLLLDAQQTVDWNQRLIDLGEAHQLVEIDQSKGLLK